MNLIRDLAVNGICQFQENFGQISSGTADVYYSVVGNGESEMPAESRKK